MDKGWLIAGQMNRSNIDDDISIIKINQYGESQWGKAIQGTIKINVRNDEANAINMKADGSLMIACTCDNTDMLLVHADNNGNILDDCELCSEFNVNSESTSFNSVNNNISFNNVYKYI